MEFSRKIFIVIIILIFTYILIRVLQKRYILNEYNNQVEGFKEGYDDSKVNSIQSNNKCTITIQDNVRARISNVSSFGNSGGTIKMLKLCNFAIKASMNTAYDGATCNIDMINFVLTRGCRYLDFEVFRDPNDGKSIVSVSTSESDYTTPISQDTPLTISDAIKYVSMYAFNSTCPNSKDPIFIQFRPRPPSTDTPEQAYLTTILNDIYQASVEYLSNQIYGNGVTKRNKVTPATPILKLIIKPTVVLVMDTTLHSNYAGLCPDLGKIINMENNRYSDISGGTITFSYSKLPEKKQLTLSDDGYTTNIDNTISQSLWIDSKNLEYNTNADSFPLFMDYSCQIVPMIFWHNGSDLYNYEMLFNECGGGIVPISLVYSKININSTPYIAYPEPAFAMPNYGNKTTSIIIIVACLGIAGFIFYRDSKQIK
jgi:hypothetical protein